MENNCKVIFWSKLVIGVLGLISEWKHFIIRGIQNLGLERNDVFATIVLRKVLGKAFKCTGMGNASHVKRRDDGDRV